ncbi:exo-beta-N-acetylmuramidase NamZ family protein [Metabacillus sp. 113a]|uniref:exo-beta-N-acetylmuramidase NamZ family protein n=1 Tax=Metabacillus sp. 113a TaxID=3404706 RepID=UPI003CFA5449
MKKWMMALMAGVLAIGMATSADASWFKKEKAKKVVTGAEMLFKQHQKLIKGKRIGLITNPTGVDRNLKSIVDIAAGSKDTELTALFGPEHGVRGDAQAGQYVEYYIDEKTGVPVYSLYGQTKKPTPEMLKNVDVLLFDIQDVGTRYYTYIYTMAYAMEAAKEKGIPIIVLDRPNPLGGIQTDGPVLEPEFSSFVGRYPIPLRHGMTVVELATLFNNEFGIDADLKVIKMKGWKRNMDFDETSLPFVMPSPNMPTIETAFVYPATGMIEGTNLSEGRGTTKPFELIGAPFINSSDLAEKLNRLKLPGVSFRAASFTPTFSKHSGKLSHGVQVYVTDRKKFKAVKTGLSIVKTVKDMYPNDFQFLASNHFNLLLGNSWVKEMLINGASVEEIEKRYEKERKQFMEIREQYLMY